MAELGGLRDAIASVVGKLTDLRAAIDALQSSTVVQDQIDEIQASIDEVGATIDELIADAKGETPPVDVPGDTTPVEPAP